MHARPVIGGVFIKMLADRATWKKWAARDTDQGRPLGGVAAATQTRGGVARGGPRARSVELLDHQAPSRLVHVRL